MNDKDRHVYEMGLRVREFGTAEAASFPPASLGGQLFAAVNAGVDSLAEHAAKHVSGSSTAKEGTATKGTARAALVRSLEKIRDTARAMAVKTPGIDTKFRLPARLPDQALRATAQAFATDAAALKDQFIQYAMPADFIEDLNEHLLEFEHSLSSQNRGMEDQVTATAAFENGIDEIVSAVR
jgi:hypothetical protein